MNVLINCEESGVVREAFAAMGHNACSCDLVPSRVLGSHLQMDARKAITIRKWDLIINHPPCTYTAICGNRWYWNSPLRIEGAELCKEIWDLSCQHCARVALEQPKTIMQRYIGKRSQAIQPYQFGHTETKETWLWLKGLPELRETNNVKQEMLLLPKNKQNRVHYMTPGKDRARERSVTYQGIAQAMATQWGTIETSV